MIRRADQQDPAIEHSFMKHWPSVKTITESLILENVISSTEWQNLFHEIHMICSWDDQGCAKLLSSLRTLVIDLFFEPIKKHLADISDDQQLLDQYTGCWKSYSILAQRLPVAFQQLDLAARNLLPRPALWPVDRQYLGGPVSLMLQSQWDNLILRTVLERSEEQAVACYCDMLLRSRRKNQGSLVKVDESAARMKAIELLVRYLDNKVNFLKIHKYHLMKRLLMDSHVDLVQERKLLSNFVETSNRDPIREPLHQIERIFRDVQASDLILKQFLKSTASPSPQDNNNQPISCLLNCDLLSLKVMNPVAWKKSIEQIDMILPEEITGLQSSLETFYSNEFEGRTLRWCHHLSNGLIEMQTSKGVYELEVTGPQLSILYCFKNSPNAKMSLDELEKLSGLSRVLLRRTVWSLCSNAKIEVQLMLSEPPVKEFKDLETCNSEFGMNDNFVLVKNGKPRAKGRVCLIGRLPIS